MQLVTLQDMTGLLPGRETCVGLFVNGRVRRMSRPGPTNLWGGGERHAGHELRDLMVEGAKRPRHVGKVLGGEVVALLTTR